MEPYSLKCGRDTVSFGAPENWRVHILKPIEPEALSMETALFRSVDHPIGEPPLKEWLKGRRKVLVIVPDVTRYAGMEQALPILYENYLKGLDVSIIFALGNHRKHTKEEQAAIVSEDIFRKVPCFDHDCFDKGGLTSFGFTATGLEVLLNSALMRNDAVIATGSISFHYLAGFGGGRKAIFPGVSGYETILGIHGKVFNPDKPGKHERAKSGILEGNPMHEEIMQGIALIPTPMFLINTVIDEDHNLYGVFSGNMRQAHEAGCAWFMDRFGCMPKERADVAIVSAGGFPKDINFIQAHKAIEHAMDAVKENGTIIVVGRCQDGLGNADFLKWFDYPSLEEMEKHVRGADKVYAQTAYATRLKASRRAIYFVSELDDEVVRKMGLIPAKTVAEAVAQADTGKEQYCHIIPNGATTLVCAR